MRELMEFRIKNYLSKCGRRKNKETNHTKHFARSMGIKYIYLKKSNEEN